MPLENLVDSLLGLNPEPAFTVSILLLLAQHPAPRTLGSKSLEPCCLMINGNKSYGWSTPLQSVRGTAFFSVKLCTKFISYIYPNITHSCNRCKQSPAHYSHKFWFCPRLATFWSEIFKTISRAYNTTITLEPHFTTLLVRRLILLHRKHAQPLSHNRWVKELLMSIRLEKLRFSLNGSLNSFTQRTGRPLLNHTESLT